MYRANRHRHRGVGLVELLVALSISAALLTAVGVAVDASFKAYAANENEAQLMQRARLALNRMTTCIRACVDHTPSTSAQCDQFETGVVTTDSGIEMKFDTTNGIAFRQSGTHLEAVKFTDNTTTGVRTYSTARVLLEGVNAGDFTITMEPQRSAQAAKVGDPRFDQLKRASIVLTVRPATTTSVAGEQGQKQPVTLSASIMPRKNLW